MKKLNLLSLIVCAILSFPSLAEEPEHDDKEHEKAESNLDHKHWEKEHGSRVPDKPERERNPSLDKPENDSGNYK